MVQWQQVAGQVANKEDIKDGRGEGGRAFQNDTQLLPHKSAANGTWQPIIGRRNLYGIRFGNLP